MMNHYQEYYQQFVQEFLACQDDEKRKKLYRELSKKYHPDSNPGVDEDIFKAASNAFRDIEKGTIKSSTSSSQTTHSNDASWASESAPRPCRQNFKTEAEVDAEIRYFEQRRVEYQKLFFHYHSLYNMMEKELYESRRMLDFNLKELHRYESLLPKFEQKLKRASVLSILLPIYDVYQYGKKHHSKLTHFTSLVTIVGIGLSTVINPMPMVMCTALIISTAVALEGVLGLFHQSLWDRRFEASTKLQTARLQYRMLSDNCEKYRRRIKFDQQHHNFVAMIRDQASSWVQECNQNLAFLNQKKQSFHSSTDKKQENDKKEQEDWKTSSSGPKVYQKKRNERGDK